MDSHQPQLTAVPVDTGTTLFKCEKTSGRVRIPLQTICLPLTGKMLSGNSSIWEKRLGIPHVARRWGYSPTPVGLKWKRY